MIIIIVFSFYIIKTLYSPYDVFRIFAILFNPQGMG